MLAYRGSESNRIQRDLFSFLFFHVPKVISLFYSCGCIRPGNTGRSTDAGTSAINPIFQLVLLTGDLNILALKMISVVSAIN